MDVLCYCFVTYVLIFIIWNSQFFAVHLQLDRKLPWMSEFKHEGLHVQTALKEHLDISTHLHNCDIL